LKKNLVASESFIEIEFPRKVSLLIGPDQLHCRECGISIVVQGVIQIAVIAGGINGAKLTVVVLQ